MANKENENIQIIIFKVRMNSIRMKKDLIRANEFLKDKVIVRSYTNLVQGDGIYWSFAFHYKDK